MAIARAVKDPNGAWREQPLEDHLRGVAQRCADAASSLGAVELAELAGRWHDLGKYSTDFQRYIRNALGLDREESSSENLPGRVDHSSAGALHAIDRLGNVGKILAQVIAAHHAGLYDAEDLVQRLARARNDGRLNDALGNEPPSSILQHAAIPRPSILGAGQEGAYALWLRMLFSCLVDADVLDSEAFADRTREHARKSFPALSALKPRFDRHMAKFVADTPVRRLRAEVLADCRMAAGHEPGLFTLTVPTGGGKTLSSMAFALEHAQRWSLKRVIFVIPYTSIIEQTADVFRSIFGDAVVEHHSNIDSSRETARSRLASENWDAPIIVTTNVQFFESLFAARSSRCRKLHNILESVVVLDEAQLLPPDFLQPIVDVLRLLSSFYPVTIVLSTATQPALASRQRFGASFRGLDAAREIVADPDQLYRRLKRVDVELPADLRVPSTWREVSERIVAEDVVLAIVNRRRDARELHGLLPQGTVHLSALMCGAHRSDVITAIKRRLEQKRTDPGSPALRVVSTQLVEAGVDIDFPVVFRAMAGLDSIAQAAGRCNREGLLGSGSVQVFIPPRGAPPGMLRIGEQASISVLHGREGDPLDRALFESYFDMFYRGCDLDRMGIAGLLKPDPSGGVVGLRTAAELFQLIPDEQVGILVPYRRDQGDDRYDGLRAALSSQGPERGLLRSLQRYIVNVLKRDFERLRNAGDVEELYPGVWALVSEAQYDPVLGLLVDPAEQTAALVV